MRYFLSKIIRLLITINRRIQKYLIAVDFRLGSGFDPDSHRQRVIRSTRSHDMVADPDEVYFADQYWLFIEAALDHVGCDRDGTYLDLGCGQGRMTVKLGNWLSAGGGTVTGIDISKNAIQQARGYAAETDPSRVAFETVDILHRLHETATERIDGVLLLEILYMHPDSRQVLNELNRVLKPGGILFVSVRSQYFNALTIAREGLFDMAPTVINARSGRVFGTNVWFNWNTSSEFREMLEKEFKFEVIDFTGLGCCSGIAGDPHASIVRPSRLNKEDRKILMDLETGLGRSVPDAGRYMLVAAVKT